MSVARPMATVLLTTCALLAALTISPNLALAQGTGIGGGGTSQNETLADSTITLRTADLRAGASELPFRDEAVAQAVEPPCAEYSSGESASAEDAEELADDGVATDEELLEASTYVRPSDGEPASHDLSEPKSLESDRPESTTKPAKSPSSQVAVSKFPQADTSRIDAVFDLWAEMRAAEKAIADALSPSGEPECLVHYWCGGERVDDVLFGGISNGPEGAYFDYVSLIGAYVNQAASTVAPLSHFLLDRDALASGIAEGEFGAQPRADFMPVFYFCRVGADGPIELTDATYSPSFAWATTIADQHDVDGARIEAIETLRTFLDGNVPQMQTIPPIERGYTFVQLPMWLWVENIDNLGQFRIEAISEELTARLTTRATLTGVTWQVGDTTIPCAVDEMKPFIHGTNSITETTPDCSHMFTQLGEYTMTATAEYYIEEQVSFRGSDQYQWPDAPWTEHPTDPYATISNQTNTMTVREIVAVNVPIDE